MNINIFISIFILNMPINVFGNSSNNNSEQKIDTSLFVQKPYLRTNYIESNIEEDIDLKNEFRIKNLPDPINLHDACNKNYVDNSIDETSLIRNNNNNDFGNYNLTNINSITLNNQPINDNEVVTKSYVDQFHNDNERSRRGLGIDFYNESNNLVKNNQDNDLNDKKLTNIDSIQVNRNPSLYYELANKKYIDDSIAENTLIRFNQTLTNYLKVSVGNDIYHLTKYNKYSLTDITRMISPNSGLYLMQRWIIECKDRNSNGKVNNFIKSTKTQSPTGNSGATSVPPIGNSFMYIETSSNNNGDYTYVKLIRTDIIQISNISFYYNRFSSSDESLRAMGRFRIDLLLDNNTWTNKYTIEKNTQFSDTSTEWKLLSLDFTEENYGVRLTYDRIDSAHADMCFSDITITHSVY